MPDTTKYYLSNDIIAYPCSNAKDNGKLNLEENMSSIVTRITNRNYVLTNGSFELSIVGNNSISIAPGQANIQGYHIITSAELSLPAPESAGENYAICFKLSRDGSRHLRGDVLDEGYLYYEGLWITYFPLEEANNDPDILVLGTVDWDGSTLSNLNPNEDIYARIDASSITMNINDPKHPEYNTITLQELMDNLKDWYVSKDGDDEYGTILFKTERGLADNNYGISIGTRNENNSEILIRPSSSTSRNLQLILGANTVNPYIKISSATINVTDNNLLIDSVNDINIFSDRYMNLTTHDKITLNTDQTDTMSINLDKNNVSFEKEDVNSEKHLFEIDANGLYYSLGLLKLSYASASKIATINGATSLVIAPNTTFSKSARVTTKLNIGSNDKTYITNTEFILEDEVKSTLNKNGLKIEQNGSNTTPYIALYSTNNASKIDMTPGLIKLTNNSGGIEFVPTSSSLSTISLKRANDANILNLTGGLTATGDIRANRVFNAVYNDLAEAFPLADPEEVIEVGELVEVDPETNKYRKCQNRYSKFVVGVCSDTYGTLLGGNPDDPENLDGYVPVGLAGRVKVKVTGLVCLGDLLTSSHIPGVAMAVEYDRAHPGTVIGKCVELTENEDEVIMLISLQ